MDDNKKAAKKDISKPTIKIKISFLKIINYESEGLTLEENQVILKDFLSFKYTWRFLVFLLVLVVLSCLLEETIITHFLPP